MCDDVHLDGLLSNYLQKKRKDQVCEYIKKANKILDIGCGVFPWSDILEENQIYFGLDIESYIFNTNISKKNISFIQADLNDALLDEINNDFDLILSLASIEHFMNPEEILKKLMLKLNNNGLIVLTTPAPWAKHILEIGASFGLFAKDKHQHQDLLGRKDIEKIANKINLDIIQFKRFLFYQNQLVVLKKT